MPIRSSRLAFLRNRYARVVSLLLFTETALFHVITMPGKVAIDPELKTFPTILTGWQMIQELGTEQRIRELLKADDILSRSYGQSATADIVSLFVARFNSPRAGIAPHSPKVCLPASGWAVAKSDIVSIGIPGQPQPISVNRYLISKDQQSMLVIYWYQTDRRIIASEYGAKFYQVLDSLLYGRAGTSFVRIALPIVDGREDIAEQTAIRFVQAAFMHFGKRLGG